MNHETPSGRPVDANVPNVRAFGTFAISQSVRQTRQPTTQGITTSRGNVPAVKKDLNHVVNFIFHDVIYISRSVVFISHDVTYSL